MSIFFWLIIILLISLILASLLKPLLSTGNDHKDSRQTYLLSIYQDRLQQLKQQHQTGEIHPQQYENAQTELELALAQELPQQTDDKDPPAPEKNLALPIIITTGIPILAILIYINTGNFKSLQNQTSPDVTATERSIEQMVANLEQRLQTQPNDVEGWIMLGRSYTAMQQFIKAQNAYATAHELAPNTPDIMLSLAEVLGYNSDNSLQGEPEQLINRALQIDPASRRGNWLKGILAFQQGDSQKAIKIWQTLLSEDNSNPQERDVLENFIAQAQQSNANNPPTTTKNTTQAHVTVEVSLASQLADSVSPEDAIFIFARAAQGPRMPLAIVRATAAELPLAVTLDDSNAMTPQMKLSAFDNVIIGARISKSGNAIAGSGDLQGLSQPLNPTQGSSIKLVITDRLP